MKTSKLVLPTDVLIKCKGVHLNCFALLILTLIFVLINNNNKLKSQKMSLSTLGYIVITHEIILPATLLQVYNTYNSSIYATMVIVSPSKEIPSPIYVINVKAFWCFSGS